MADPANRETVLRFLERLRHFQAELPPERIGDLAALAHLSQTPYTRGNALDLLVDGEATFGAIFAAMDSAERYTYIVRRGASEVVPQLREDADIVVRVPAQVFKEMLAQLRNPAVTIAKDFEVVKGGKLGFVRFMRLFVPVEE